MLDLKEYRYWKPIPTITEWLSTRVIKPGDRVVDVGCGHCPFPRADVGVDRLPRSVLEGIWDKLQVNSRPPVLCHHDFGVAPMPFKDKEFDFVYCRHTLEDMYDPFLLLCDMQRIGKAGYIETPSPVVELTKGVDGYQNSWKWRGYFHHRFLVWWSGGADNELRFVSKYPIVEHYEFPEEKLEAPLCNGADLWNTYYLWKDEIKWRHFDCPFDFTALGYQEFLWLAAVESGRSVSDFCHMVNEQMQQVA